MWNTSCSLKHVTAKILNHFDSAVTLVSGSHQQKVALHRVSCQQWLKESTISRMTISPWIASLHSSLSRVTHNSWSESCVPLSPRVFFAKFLPLLKVRRQQRLVVNHMMICSTDFPFHHLHSWSAGQLWEISTNICVISISFIFTPPFSGRTRNLNFKRG